MNQEIIKIDAQGKEPGRLAGEVADHLRGKNRVDFQRNTVPNLKVEVSNVSLMRITGKKEQDKEYIRYSGYPGGQKRESMREVKDKKGSGEILKRAVYGMLPGNRLRAKMMKNLIINE